VPDLLVRLYDLPDVPPSPRLAVEGVVVRQVPDPEEPMTFHLTPGVGVFLTMTSPGYERWCDLHSPKK
jgi:hypothetical protein